MIITNHYTKQKFEIITNDLDIDNVGLYVITFNSPNQVRTLIKSMKQYDEDFVTKPQWVMLDNSTDLSTSPEYEEIANEYNMIYVKKENLRYLWWSSMDC